MDVADWPRPQYTFPPSLCTEVHDGDTPRVLLQLPCWARAEEWLRLSDASSPELHQPGGTAARDHLSGLVLGRTVYVETFKMATREEAQRTFARLRALVYLDVGGELVSVGALMVAAGHARPIEWA